MTDTDLLWRRCKRLLAAYPNWYRDERGLEMLTTMLDAARPDQRRPALHDLRDVLMAGLLCRLRPPRPVGYRIVAGLVASFPAIVGATLLGWLAVSALTPPTTVDEAPRC